MATDLFKVLDEEYRDRVGAAVFQAIVNSSLSPDGSVSSMRSGEIISSLLTVIAFLASTSEAASTPQKRRELSQEFGKRIRARMDMFRGEYESGKMDFLHVRPAETH